MIFPMNFSVNLQCPVEMSFCILHIPRIDLCLAKVQQCDGYNFSQETKEIRQWNHLTRFISLTASSLIRDHKRRRSEKMESLRSGSTNKTRNLESLTPTRRYGNLRKVPPFLMKCRIFLGFVFDM